MNNKDLQDIFDGLRKPPDFLEDPDLRIDQFDYIIERYSHGADHSYGWRVDDQGKVIGNMAGKPPIMG